MGSEILELFRFYSEKSVLKLSTKDKKKTYGSVDFLTSDLSSKSKSITTQQTEQTQEQSNSAEKDLSRPDQHVLLSTCKRMTTSSQSLVGGLSRTFTNSELTKTTCCTFSSIGTISSSSKLSLKQTDLTAILMTKTFSSTHSLSVPKPIVGLTTVHTFSGEKKEVSHSLISKFKSDIKSTHPQLLELKDCLSDSDEPLSKFQIRQIPSQNQLILTATQCLKYKIPYYSILANILKSSTTTTLLKLHNEILPCQKDNPLKDEDILKLYFLCFSYLQEIIHVCPKGSDAKHLTSLCSCKAFCKDEDIVLQCSKKPVANSLLNKFYQICSCISLSHIASLLTKLFTLERLLFLPFSELITGIKNLSLKERIYKGTLTPDDLSRILIPSNFPTILLLGISPFEKLIPLCKVIFHMELNSNLIDNNILQLSPSEIELPISPRFFSLTGIPKDFEVWTVCQVKNSFPPNFFYVWDEFLLYISSLATHFSSSICALTGTLKILFSPSDIIPSSSDSLPLPDFLRWNFLSKLFPICSESQLLSSSLTPPICDMYTLARFITPYEPDFHGQIMLTDELSHQAICLTSNLLSICLQRLDKSLDLFDKTQDLSEIVCQQISGIPAFIEKQISRKLVSTEFMSLLHSSAPTFSSKTLASKFYQSEMKTPENFYNDDCSNETSISPDFVVSKYVKPTSSIPFDAVDDSSFCSSHIEGEIPKVSIGGKSSRIPEKQSTFLERLISSSRMEDAFMWLEESLDMNEWKVFQPPTFKTMLEVFKEFKFKPVTNHSDLTFSAFSHSSISSSSHHDSSLSSVSSFSSSSSASSSESPSSSESSSSESSSSSSSFASSGSQSSSSSSSSSDSVVSSSFEPSSSSSSDSTSSSSSFSSVSSSFCSSSLSSLSSSSFRPSLLDHDHHPLDENAIRRVLKAIPRSSQPGLDGWSMNLLLRCITIKSSILTSLQSCLNKMLHLNWFPKIWFTDRLIIVPVGHHQSSLRVTTTMNLFRIILSKTVLLLSEHTLLKQIPFTQYGIDFSWGRETVLALLTNIIDISKLSKSSLIISNMTLSSPLQSVDKSILLSQLKSINAPSSLLKFMEFYFSSSRLLYLENPIPLETTFQIGLLRKCPLTPVLFSLYTNEILVKINQLKHSQQNFGEIPSLSSRIHPPIKHILDKLEIPRVIAYFDSIFLMSATKDEAAYSFKVCFDAAIHLKLTPNLHKSTSLLLDDTGNPKMESCISIGLDKNSEVISISSSATPFLRGRMESSPSVSSDQIILDITPQSSLHSLGTIVSPFGKERNISFQDRCNKLLKLLHLASDCLTSQYFLLFARWVVIMKIVSQLANFSIHSNLLHNFDIQLNDLIRKTLNFPKESPIVLINFPLNKSGLGIPAVRDLYVMCSLMTHITVKSRNYMLQNFEKEFQKQLEPDVLPPSDNLEIDLSAYSTDLKLPLTFTDIECEHFSGTFCLISRYIQTHNEPDFNSNSKVVLHQLWETLHNSKYNMLLEKMNPSVIDKWKMNKISSMFTSDWHILKILPKSSFERFSNQEMEQFFSLNLPGQTNELHSSLLKSITSDDSQFIEILGSMSTHITFQLASFIRTVPGCQIKIKESGEENLLIKIIISNSIQTNEEKLLNLTRDSNHQIHLIIEVKVTNSIVPDSIDESDSIPDTTPTSFVQIIKFKTSLKGELGNKAKILLRMLFMMSKTENRNQFMYLFRKHYSLIIQSGNIFLQHRTIKSQPSIIQPIQELSFWRDIYKSSFFLPYLNQIILNHHDGLINIEKYLDDIPDRLRSMLESYSLFLDYHAKCPGWIFNSSSEIVVKSQTEQPKVSTSRESKLLPSTSSPEHTIITTSSLPVSNSIPTAILTGSSLSTGSSHQSSKRRVPFPRTPLMEHDSLLLLKKALQEQSPSLSHPTLAQVPTTGQIKIFPTNEGPLLQKIMPRKKEQNRSFESTASHHDSSAESDSTSSDNSDDGYSHDEYCSRHVRQRKRLDSSFDISGFVLSTKSESPTKRPEETTPIHAASQITPSLVPEVSKSQPIIVLDEVFSLVPG